MRTVHFLLATATSAALASLGISACDDAPRGEQGIDFLIDGSYYSVPPAAEAGADAHGPCAEAADAAVCAQSSSAGVPATHFIVCTGSDSPFALTCLAPPNEAAEAGVPDATEAGAFCCTTGVL